MYQFYVLLVWAHGISVGLIGSIGSRYLKRRAIRREREAITESRLIRSTWLNAKPRTVLEMAQNRPDPATARTRAYVARHVKVLSMRERLEAFWESTTPRTFTR